MDAGRKFSVRGGRGATRANQETDKGRPNNHPTRRMTHQQQRYATGGEQRQQRQGSTRTSEKKTERASSSTCYRCGRFNHPPNECFHINWTCYNCKKRSHIRPACRTNKTTRVGYLDAASEKSDSDSSDSISKELANLFPRSSNYHMRATYIPGNTRIEPQQMNVDINNIPTRMEIDSGAAMSIIQLDLKNKYFNQIAMLGTNLEFINYDESISRPVGMLKGLKIKANSI